MIRTTALITILAAHGLSDEPADLLRLTNGELEGSFSGIDKSGIIRWEREDGIAPMEFKPDKIRQVILRGGISTIPGNETSHVSLVNQDQIPGKVISLDADNVTIESGISEPIIIPRDSVSTISPNPYGGKLIYAGPFNQDEWKIQSSDDEDSDEGGAESEDDDADSKETEGWHHLGSRWYCSDTQKALMLDAGMPAKSSFLFHIDWRSRPSVAIGFHSDFMPEPERKKEDDEPVRSSRYDITKAFGNSMVLLLRHNYAQLQRCGYDKDGKPYIRQIRAASSMVRFDDTGSADIELRSNLKEGVITLFVDGNYMMQWQLDTTDLLPAEGDDEENKPERYPLGSGIGFQPQSNDSPFRISDIYIAEWNGMPDAARSMDSETSDVVLLTNGTDRFSGKVTTISEGMLNLESKYASLNIPMSEVADIRFAKENLNEEVSEDAREIRIHMKPVGRISGFPVSSTSDSIQIRSPFFGETSLSLESASILEFKSGGRFLNFWDEDL